MSEQPTPETDAFFFRTDIDWDMEVDFARRLERERDEALAYADKLAAGLPEGMLPKDVEILRDANLALAVALEELNSINAERAAHRGTRKAWIELDDNRQILEKQLTSERALADRLAALLQRNRDLYGGQQVDYQCGCWDCEYLGPIDEALAAWKEARSEVKEAMEL